MQKKNIGAFIWRGALGGTIGPLLFVTYTMFMNPYNIPGLLYIPIILFITGVIGGTIGAIIWVCYVKAGKNFGIFKRAIIGVIFSMCLWKLYQYTRVNYGIPLSWSQSLYEVTIFGVIIGALPGIMARPKDNEEQKSRSIA